MTCVFGLFKNTRDRFHTPAIEVAHHAIQEVVEAVQSGDLSISTANEIAKLDYDEQEKLLEQGIENISHKEVKQKKKAGRSPKRDAAEKDDTYITEPDTAEEDAAEKGDTSSSSSQINTS